VTVGPSPRVILNVEDIAREVANTVLINPRIEVHNLDLWKILPGSTEPCEKKHGANNGGPE